MSEYKNKKIKDEAILIRSENLHYQKANTELNEQVKQLLESIEVLKQTNEELNNKLQEKMKSDKDGSQNMEKKAEKLLFEKENSKELLIENKTKFKELSQTNEDQKNKIKQLEKQSMVNMAIPKSKTKSSSRKKQTDGQ